MDDWKAFPQLEWIFKRRSIRKFKSEPVPREWIKVLLQAGMAAPSAMNNQPWEFVVIDDAEMLENIRQSLVFGRQKAPLAIAVCGNKRRARNKLSASEFWIQDCSAAVENILLAATALGLGSVWLGVHPVKLFSQAISRHLHLPRHIAPLCVVYLGFPMEEKDAHTKYSAEHVFWQVYGNSDPQLAEEE